MPGSHACESERRGRADFSSSSDIRFLDHEEVEAMIRAEPNGDDELAATLALVYRTAAMTGLRMGS